MPKANQTLTTSTCNGLTRRNVLATAAAALAAPDAMARTVLAPSPEFLEYRRCDTEGMSTPSEILEGDTPENEEKADALLNAVCDAREHVADRDPRSWADVAELAQVVHDQLWQGWDQHSENPYLEASLLKAIFAMAEKDGLGWLGLSSRVVPPGVIPITDASWPSEWR